MDWVSALSRRSCGVAKSETDSSLLRRDYLREIAIAQVIRAEVPVSGLLV